MLTLLAALLAAPLLIRGPVVVGVGSDRASITWETSDRQQNGTVRFGASAGSYTGSVQDPSYAEHHHVQLMGLAPSTTIHFSIDTDANAEDSSFTTAPLPGSRAPFKFVVYGDNRTEHAPHQTVVNAIRGEPDIAFLVHTGDMAENTYPTNLGWDNFFAIEHELLRSKPIFTTPGNHETLTDGFSHYAQFFAAPTFSWPTNTVKYGAYDWGNAHLVLLDTFDSSLPGVEGISAAQLEWMKADLDAAKSAGRQIFAVTHHGPYSHSNHGPNLQAQQLLVPELTSRGARAIFQGHDHVYERGCSGGIDYLIAGGGGAPLYSVDANGAGVLKAIADYSYVVVTVNGDAVTGEMKLTDGGVFDRFSLPTGVCSDGGVPDSGVPDAGAPDAGAPDGGSHDAGSDPDGGNATLSPGGCSCGSGPAAAWSLLPLSALLVALRSRRRRQR